MTKKSAKRAAKDDLAPDPVKKQKNDNILNDPFFIILHNEIFGKEYK